MHVLMRCCIYNAAVCDILCGITNQDLSSNIFNGGGDGIIVGAMFRFLSLHGSSSSNKDAALGECIESDNSGKMSAPGFPTIAQGLKFCGKHNASLE